MDRYPLPPDVLKAILQQRLLAAPFTATLHITQYCNLRCEFCWHHSHLKRNQTRRYHVPAEQAISLIKELASLGTREISLSAEGEPSCHPHFAQIVKTIKEAGLTLKIITNFSLFSDEIATAYAMADHLMINLAAVTAADYRGIHAPRVQSSFMRIRNNLRIFSRLSARQGHPVITLGYVITKNTYRQIPKMLAFARDHKIASVRFKLMDPSLHTKTLMLNKAERNELACSIARLLKSSCTVTHNLPDIIQELTATPDAATPKNFGRCLVASFVMDIAEDGTVRLCCQNKKLEIGQTSRQSLRAIWRGSRSRRLRLQAIRQINFKSALWRHCYQCPYSNPAYYINKICKNAPGHANAKTNLWPR